MKLSEPNNKTMTDWDTVFQYFMHANFLWKNQLFQGEGVFY